ncbi:MULTISPECIES: iron chelate uptake ABC transporter family permease subunit, partial [Pseudomonas]|uniref:iron chelate uptake ABC transporter family permease subunit n=1 Tax=Pseudomonas TaxID=286 RepID=UPI00257F6DDC
MSARASQLSVSAALLLCAGALLVLCLASLLFGAGNVDPLQGVRALLGQGAEEARFVVFELRLPRTLLGLLVGVALGAAGVVLQ